MNNTFDLHISKYIQYQQSSTLLTVCSNSKENITKLLTALTINTAKV